MCMGQISLAQIDFVEQTRVSQIDIEIISCTRSPTAMFGLVSLPLTQGLLHKLDVVQRRMFRSIVGWVRIPEVFFWGLVAAWFNVSMVRTGPKCFHFQTLKIFHCRGFICRMFWQRAQGNLQLPAGHFGCSVSKIMQINRWTAARSWLECGEVLHLWNERVKNFIANVHVNTWSYITCKNYWNLATHVAAFPAHRWVQRLPSWHPIGTRRVGRPRHTSESKLHAYCRYANLGSWRKVYDVVWNSHLPSFVNFCRMYIAIVYILCFLRVRLVTGSPQACRPDLKRPLVIVGFK